MSYHAIVEHTPESGYWASVRELPGCYSCGDTLEELQANIREAIALHDGRRAGAIRGMDEFA